MSKTGAQMGFGPMRVMTDVSAERYWTVGVPFTTTTSTRDHGTPTASSASFTDE